MYKLIIPRENVSDNEYKIISILKKRNDFVNKNDLLGEIESSKALVELHAEASGYFFSDRKEGEMISVGEIFALINPIEFDDKQSVSTRTEQKKETLLSGIIVTQKAEELIKLHQIPISALVGDAEDGSVISERDVQSFLDANLEKKNTEDLAGIYLDYPGRKMKRIGIIGAGTSAIQIIDLMASLGGYLPTCIFDDTPLKIKKKLLGVPVLSAIDFDTIAQLHKDSLFDELIIGIPTSIPFRKKVFNELKNRNLPITTLLHNSVYVGLHLEMGEGNIIFPQTHIGSCTKIGNNNFITAKCSIEHNNIIGSHCTFGPGVMFSGGVTVGDGVKFGTGVFVEPNIHIGDNAVISSGSIITKNVEADTVVINNSNLKFKSGGTSR